MFITFTKEFEHFVDNIQNGFRLNEHQVEFLPSTHDLLKSLIPLWDQYDIQGSTISEIRNLRDKHGSLNNDFWVEFVEMCKKDSNFSFHVQWTLGQTKTRIKMKCFTEIRDNQKINPSHTGYFGNYGILLKRDWLLKNGGCPVIYVDNSMSLTNIIGRNSSLMKTLDECTRKLAKIERSIPAYHAAFFDLMSFVETSKHIYEYEWRIVSGHNLGGTPFLPQIDRVKFDLSDVHSFFVPDEDSKTKTLAILNTMTINKDEIPPILLTDDIVLTDDEIRQIEKIKSRKK